MVAADIMTKNPMTAQSTDSLRSVLGFLMELDVRHLPVLEDGQLVGIISDRDLGQLTTPLVDETVVASRLESILEQPVSKVMSSDVLSVDPEAEISEIVDLMIEHRVGAIPVVAPDTQDLVGIVSYIDVLRAAGDALG